MQFSCGHGMRAHSKNYERKLFLLRVSAPRRYSREVGSHVCPLSSTADLKSQTQLSPWPGRLSINTETLLYVVWPYDYYHHVKTLTTYFSPLEYSGGNIES